jgi:hypothetical protein
MIEDLRLPSSVSDNGYQEVELTDEWKEFKETLFQFQQEYARTCKEASDVNYDVKHKINELSNLKNMASIFTDGSDLKARVSDMIQQFEIDTDIPGLTSRLAELRGSSAAQRSVLDGTNVEALVKFQCFVCLDRYVDLCLDPCGHVLCVTCWNRLPSNDRRCPGCRSAPQKAIKIFTLS